jgi:hypothetical protein
MANVRTLPELAALLDPPDPARRQAVYAAVSEADLVDMGTSTATERILFDAPAFFDAVYTIYGSLAPAKRELLTGFAYSLLPIAVDEAIKLQGLHEAQRATSQAGGADKAGAVAILASRRRESLSLRNNAIRAIRPHLATDEQRARLNAFRGTAENAQKLADGLRGVAQTLEDLRAAAAPGVLSLLDEVGLGKPYAKKLADTAEFLLEADRATAGAPPQRMVSQRELDLQDGRVLHMIGLFFRAFQSGHDSDATILVPPLTRLTRLFKGHRATKASEPLSPVEGPVTD